MRKATGKTANLTYTDRPDAMPEMAVWAPDADHTDAGHALADLDRAGMRLLGGLGLVTLVVALFSVAITMLA